MEKKKFLKMDENNENMINEVYLVNYSKKKKNWHPFSVWLNSPKSKLTTNYN